MVKTTVWRDGLLDLFFLNTTFDLLGDATGIPGSAAAGNVYLSAHETDPLLSGDQTTGETGYTGYARVALPRAVSHWVRVGQFMSNVSQVQFGANTDATSVTITHLGLGTALTLAGKLCYVTALVTPVILAPSPFIMQFDELELVFTER